MAPRKRTTKQRKNNPKTAKLEAFLEDFDSEVKTRVGQLKEKLNQLLKNVDNSYNMAQIKLPKAVRQMVWLEHFRAEKPKSPEVDNTKREEEAAIVDSVVAEDHAVLLKSVKKTSKKKGAANCSSEDEKTPATTRKGKATRKPPTTSKRAKALTISKQNNSIRRSTRKPLVTPARSMLDSSFMMGPTPLITPRLTQGNEDIVINVPIGNGESIQLLASQLDSVDLSLLDETALTSIRLLQNRLTTLCGTSQ
ncbi:hypothetical protein EPR50_G00146810 [Perca flavescens]|uniref:Uncharacterized protein n=1 Tax=Perca flavescens TaxID=8167 RepID=A0A484CJF0_PERFV|nr:hypothetical protein EPR50_G00146810 [Perca flavescens]